MALAVWCGQFNIVEGQVQEDGPYVGIFEGTHSASGVGVYIVAEPVGSASPRLCNEVVELIARAFGQPEQALTANLLRALAAGHQHVRDWNRLHSTGPAAGVAISCMATRGDEAYLAQSGSALAISQTAGRFRVTQPVGDDSRRPLGLGERAAPVFTRLTLHPGDVILLLHGTGEAQVDRGVMHQLASGPPEEAMPLLFLRVRHLAHFGALYAGVIQGAAAAPPATAAGPGTGPAPVRQRPRERAVPQFRGYPPGAGALPPGPPEDSFEPDDVNGTHYGTPPRQSLPRPQSPRRPGGAGLGSLGDGLRLPSRRVLALLAATVIVVLLLWLAVPALARRGADDRYDELLRTADAAVAAASRAPDATARRELLNHAQADLLEARQIRPDTPEVATRLDRVSLELSTLDGSRDLAGLEQVADLTAAGIAQQSGIEMAAAGGNLYLLDTGQGKVLALGSGGTATIFEEGRTLGGEKAGKARHITSAPDGNGRRWTLLVLDANRRLFALGPDGAWRGAPLPAAETWKSDTAIAANGAALYVLDAQGDQVWRYTGAPGIYDARPEPLLTKGALRDASAIGVAGSPVITSSSGKLLRIIDGREEELRPSGLDRPLLAPAAPQFNPADSLLYIADRGNGRIVLLDSGGVFQAQLVHRRLPTLRAMTLDEERGLLYAVSGQTLFSAPLGR